VSRNRAISVLRGGALETAYGLSWVPADALRVLTWQEAGADPAETLAAVAVAMQLDLVLVPASEPWAEDAVRLLRHADVAAAWAVSGVLGRIAARSNWGDVLRRSVSEPGALAFSLSEVLHDALVETRAGVAARADALVVADDLAGAAGWLIAPDFALEALVPCYRLIAGEVSEPAVFHSDGDVRALYPALASAGFSAVHIAVQGQAAIERVVRAAREAGLVPVGGIESAALHAEGATTVGTRVRDLTVERAMVICDDGGMTSAEELAAYAAALAATRGETRESVD